MEDICKCGNVVKGEIPDGIQEVYICDECGRYWDEEGNVLDAGFKEIKNQ